MSPLWLNLDAQDAEAEGANNMNHDEKLVTIRAMTMYGGSFVNALAQAWLLADEDNCRRIEAAFPEYMKKYGPGGVLADRSGKVPT